MASQDPNVVVYDGVCIFCNRMMRWIVAHDRAGRFVFAPVQSETGGALFDRHGLDPGDVDTLLLVADGRSYERSDAMIRIAAELDGWWRALRFLKIAPRPLRDFGS